MGVQRSGTTLLRNLMIKHPDICIPYENGFYKVLQKKYNKGLNNQNSEQFLIDLFHKVLKWNNIVRFLNFDLKYLKHII